VHVASTFVIPALVILLMTIVGLDLSVRHFRRAAAFPALVTLTLAAQLVVLRAVAVVVKDDGYAPP
jgi:predicted Na+-dependent transporter